ncbi:MAG: carbamoyltransferase [bacterium]|nr:carbamoyltransferase [bacterium]
MLTLGINAYHGDSAAAILRDGKIVMAVEEERFNRTKHWAGFPKLAIEACLKHAGAKLEDVEYIAVNRNPNAQMLRKAMFVMGNLSSWRFIADRLANRGKVLGLEEQLAEAFGVDLETLKGKMQRVEHHLAHCASAYHFSGYKNAAVLSVDAFGDWTSTMLAHGRDGKIEDLKRVFFPHSLGVVYSAVTQLLGFPHYGDEYKVMGLAPYGTPNVMEPMRELVSDDGDGGFHINESCFMHVSGKWQPDWEGGSPTLPDLFSPKMEELLGPARKKGEELTQRHMDIAASLQARYEEVFASILNVLHKRTGTTDLCLVGGCSMNSVANGKILELSPFREIYVPPQPGDAGGAIGAAAHVYAEVLGKQCETNPRHAFLGPGYDDDYIAKMLAEKMGSDNGEIVHEVYDDDAAMCRAIAEEISQGKVIGWFQGRMEWGPRALGNRSILADPRRADMKDILNLKIKRRESFRPFAPSVLRSGVDEYFETDYEVPFMSMVFQIREEKREGLPAVTHVNGSGRLQSVDQEDNPLYWKLIDSFREITGVPMILNTSFNENEPIVCRPEEALDCFLRTKMDTLALGCHVLRRKDES